MTTAHDQRVEQLFAALRSELDTQHLRLDQTNVTDLAKRMANIIPRNLSGNAMAEKVGPFYDGAGVQSWLGITRQALLKRRSTRNILGCRTADGHWIYPVWQFQEDGKLIPGLPDVLRALSAGMDDGWTWALWLVGTVSDQLDGKTVIQWLTDGGDLQPVLRLAATDAAAWVA